MEQQRKREEGSLVGSTNQTMFYLKGIQRPTPVVCWWEGFGLVEVYHERLSMHDNYLVE